MKTLPAICVWCMVAILVLSSGCARNTIEKRRQERQDAYVGLPAELQQLVDEGKIKVGMPMDAVYIAWGKPDQSFATESEQGATITWLYHGTHLESYRYWTRRPVYSKNRYYEEPYLAQDYQVRPYVSAEVVFEQGLVKEWRTLPYPVY